MSHFTTTPEHEFPRLELPSFYAKAIVAIAMAVLAVVVTALGDDVVTLVEGLGMLVALCVALGVYLVPNLPAGPAVYLKAGVAVLGTAAQAAIPLLIDARITSSGIVLIALAALNVLAVGVVPNPDPQVLIPTDVEPFDITSFSTSAPTADQIEDELRGPDHL